MPRTLVEIAADIIEEKVNQGVVSTDLYMEGTNSGLNVDVIIENAEGLYDIAAEELEETLDHN